MQNTILYYKKIFANIIVKDSYQKSKNMKRKEY